MMVSSTVKDLVAGSGLKFVDRGAYTLKGVPDEWDFSPFNGNIRRLTERNLELFVERETSELSQIPLNIVDCCDAPSAPELGGH